MKIINSHSWALIIYIIFVTNSSCQKIFYIPRPTYIIKLFKMIQEKINIKYLPKKKLFTVFTQDVLTSVKQQYKFNSVYCLSIKNHHQIFTNYFQTNELMSILPVRKHFALVTVTLSTGRLCQWGHVPMWGRCGQCGHPRQCETTASVPGTSCGGGVIQTSL